MKSFIKGFTYFEGIFNLNNLILNHIYNIYIKNETIRFNNIWIIYYSYDYCS